MHFQFFNRAGSITTFVKTHYFQNAGSLVFVLFLSLIVSCKSKSDVEPEKLIVDNDAYYISFNAGGKEYKFTEREISAANFHGGKNTGEGYNGNGYKVSILAASADGGVPQISILIYSPKSIKDSTYISDGKTTMVALDCFLPANNAQKYQIFGTNGTSEAKVFDLGPDNVKGTFSGVLFSFGEKLVITDGKFYVPRIN